MIKKTERKIKNTSALFAGVRLSRCAVKSLGFSPVGLCPKERKKERKGRQGITENTVKEG